MGGVPNHFYNQALQAPWKFVIFHPFFDFADLLLWFKFGLVQRTKSQGLTTEILKNSISSLIFCNFQIF